MTRRACFSVGLVAVIFPAQLAAQGETVRLDSATVAAVVKVQDELARTNRTFKFGLSIAWRHVIGPRESMVSEAAINFPDSTVFLEERDRGAVVLSGIVVAFPWKRPSDTSCCSSNWLWRLGFASNLNLLEFGGEKIGTFNQQVEGGLGVAWRLSDDFSLAMTVERISGRRPRSFVQKGEVLRGAVTEEAFRQSNDKYFFNDDVSAIAFKFAYFFR